MDRIPGTPLGVVRILTVLVALLLQVGWFRQPVPVSLKLLQLGLLALSLWRPAAGLIAFAACAPLTTELWTWLAPPDLGVRIIPTELHVTWTPGTALCEQLLLATIAGTAVRQRLEGLRLSRPALLLAAVALASAATTIPARAFAAAPDSRGWRMVTTIVDGTYAMTPQSGEPLAPLFFGILLVEGLLLACLAESVVRTSPVNVGRLVGASFLANTAATLVTLYSAALASSQHGATMFERITWLLVTRISPQYDKNAVASVLVLVMLSGLMLLRRSVVSKVGVGSGLLILAAGLWLTGSRTGLAAIVTCLCVVAAAAVLRKYRRHRALLFGAAAALVLITATMAIAIYPVRTGSVRSTAMGRWLVTKAALSMSASAPVFGVGVGTFIERSGEFGTGRDPYGLTTPNENAHNNFLQVLAELGTVGLLAFLTVLLSVGFRPLPSSNFADDRRWLMTGIIGFLLTCLTGHPLLVPEAAFAFWMFAGLTTGLAPQAESRRAILHAIPAVALLVLISIPVRAFNQFREFDFTDVGLGLSDWRTDNGNVSYRAAGATFSLYVRANKLVLIPLRLGPGTQRLAEVQASVDDRLVNSMRLESTWQGFRMNIPSKRWRSVRVDFRVTPSSPGISSAWRVHVGATEPH
jgi:O-antigen ligase